MRATANERPDRSLEFARLYDAEHSRVVRWAALALNSDRFASDLVHDAFLELWRRWDDVLEPRAYLYRSVANGCRDVVRSRIRTDRLALRLNDRPSAHVETSLLDVLGHLPFNQRAAVVLRYYCDMSERDIADVLGCRPGSVGPWIARALTNMRKELA